MIKLFAMDVDGTLTDGGIYMDGAGGEMKRFDVQDGQGIAQLLRKGVKVVFISGRFSAPTQRRAEDLKITRCVNGIKDKLPDIFIHAIYNSGGGFHFYISIPKTTP